MTANATPAGLRYGRGPAPTRSQRCFGCPKTLYRVSDAKIWLCMPCKGMLERAYRKRLAAQGIRPDPLTSDWLAAWSRLSGALWTGDETLILGLLAEAI